jgi:hypothetical protein
MDKGDVRCAIGAWDLGFDLTFDIGHWNLLYIKDFELQF